MRWKSVVGKSVNHCCGSDLSRNKDKLSNSCKLQLFGPPQLFGTPRTYLGPVDNLGSPGLFGTPRTYFGPPWRFGTPGFIWDPLDLFWNPRTILGPRTYLGPLDDSGIYLGPTGLFWTHWTFMDPLDLFGVNLFAVRWYIIYIRILCCRLRPPKKYLMPISKIVQYIVSKRKPLSNREVWTGYMGHSVFSKTLRGAFLVRGPERSRGGEARAAGTVGNIHRYTLHTLAVSHSQIHPK